MGTRARLLVIGLGALAVSTAVASGLRAVGVHQGYAPAQPIAFPHKVHAGDNKIACLYCHSAARSSRHAGIPAASVCMNCHRLLEKQTLDIQKLREAVQLERPIRWVKVHNLPDFVYFNHSQHVLSGMECQRCHGPIEQMDRVEQVSPLTMGWCLSCHRERAHIPTASVARAASHLSHPPKPTAGTDCVSCHY
jgi:hypothetical protein